MIEQHQGGPLGVEVPAYNLCLPPLPPHIDQPCPPDTNIMVIAPAREILQEHVDWVIKFVLIWSRCIHCPYSAGEDVWGCGGGCWWVGL